MIITFGDIKSLMTVHACSAVEGRGRRPTHVRMAACACRSPRACRRLSSRATAVATVAALAAGVLVFVLSHGASLLLPLAQVPRVGWRLLRQPPPSPLIVLVPPTGVVTPAMQCEQLPRASGAASTRPGNTPRCCRVADADLNDDSAAREVAASAGTDTGDPRSQWRVLLVTLLHGPTWRRGSEFGDASWDNKLRYAQRHGYELADGSGLVNASRHPAWSKALIVSHYLHTRRDVDVVAFFDADALFMRSDVPLVQ